MKCSFGIANFFKEISSLSREKAMASHSSTVARKIPWMEKPGRLQSMGSLRVRHDWATSLSLSTFMNWRRKWQPTPVFLPWRIPWTEKPGRLQSMGSHRVGHDWSNLAAAAVAASLSQSIVFLYFFALITEESFLISPSCSLELCIQKYIPFFFPLPFMSFLFSAICKTYSDNHFALFHFFFLGMILITASGTILWTS